MMTRTKLGAAAVAIAATLGISAPASAAFINIDDRDASNVTITAGDFEGGFSVNGNLLTIGLGNSASITLSDGGHGISGSWVDLGQADALRIDIMFAFLADATAVTSGVEFGTSTNGSMGTLSGSFGALLGAPYFSTNDATFDQNDPTTRTGNVPYLSVAFIPEAPVQVPEPGTLALLGMASLVAFSRRRA